MAGIFEVLDSLGDNIANVAGRVVDAKTQIELAKTPQANPAKVPDQSAAAPAAALSGGAMMNTSSPMFWIGVLIVVGGGMYLIARAAR